VLLSVLDFGDCGVRFTPGSLREWVLNKGLWILYGIHNVQPVRPTRITASNRIITFFFGRLGGQARQVIASSGGGGGGYENGLTGLTLFVLPQLFRCICPLRFPHPRRGITITLALSSDPIFSANDRTRFAPSPGDGANLTRSFTSPWDTRDDIPSEIRTMCEYSEPEPQFRAQKNRQEGGLRVPFSSFWRTSGSGVTPNGLYLKSPKLLVFSNTPIHRASPKESVTSAEPMTRRNRVDSMGVPA
jgi:hypothetical protein